MLKVALEKEEVIVPALAPESAEKRVFVGFPA